MNTIQLFLSSIMVMFLTGALAFSHWIFGLTWFAALIVFVYTGFKIIWVML